MALFVHHCIDWPDPVISESLKNMSMGEISVDVAAIARCFNVPRFARVPDSLSGEDL